MNDGPIEPAKKRGGRPVVVHSDGRVMAQDLAVFVDLDRSHFSELKARGLFVERPESG
jgi:hypothetical protein